MPCHQKALTYPVLESMREGKTFLKPGFIPFGIALHCNNPEARPYAMQGSLSTYVAGKLANRRPDGEALIFTYKVEEML
jgi:hypothetical protein